MHKTDGRQAKITKPMFELTCYQLRTLNHLDEVESINKINMYRKMSKYRIVWKRCGLGRLGSIMNYDDDEMYDICLRLDEYN